MYIIYDEIPIATIRLRFNLHAVKIQCNRPFNTQSIVCICVPFHFTPMLIQKSFSCGTPRKCNNAKEAYNELQGHHCHYLQNMHLLKIIYTNICISNKYLYTTTISSKFAKAYYITLYY